MWGTFGPQIQCNTQAVDRLNAKADIPSGVQKYPNTTK